MPLCDMPLQCDGNAAREAEHSRDQAVVTQVQGANDDTNVSIGVALGHFAEVEATGGLGRATKAKQTHRHCEALSSLTLRNDEEPLLHPTVSVMKSDFYVTTGCDPLSARTQKKLKALPCCKRAA